MQRRYGLLIGLVMCVGLYQLFTLEREQLERPATLSEDAILNEPVRPSIDEPRDIRRVTEPEPYIIEDQAFEPANVHEEALLAATSLSGQGLVRCVLPIHIDSIDLGRLHWAGQANRILTFATTEAFGHRALFAGGAPPRPHFSGLPTTSAREDYLLYVEEKEAWNEQWNQPIAYVNWSNAYPDALGDCDVTTTVRKVMVDVHVLDPEGEPVSNALVRSSVGETSLGKTDPNGWGTVSIWQDHPTLVTASHLDRSTDIGINWEADERVIYSQQLTEVVLELSSRDKRVDWTQQANGREAQEEVLRLALEDPTLSRDAVVQVETWIEQMASNRSQNMARLREAQEERRELTE